MIQGRCLCGDIQWEHAGKPLFMGSCHCSICRKTLGSAFTMEVIANSEGYQLTRGHERIASLRLDVNFNTQVSWSNFLQYDNESDVLGLNSRLRWILSDGREAFLIFNPTLRAKHRHLSSIRTDTFAKVEWTFRY